MADTGGRISLDQIISFEKTKESFDGIEFAADGFGSVVLAIEVDFEVVDIVGDDGANICFAHLGDELRELLDILDIG